MDPGLGQEDGEHSSCMIQAAYHAKVVACLRHCRAKKITLLLPMNNDTESDATEAGWATASRWKTIMREWRRFSACGSSRRRITHAGKPVPLE